jgi:hypothetical protein
LDKETAARLRSSPWQKLDVETLIAYLLCSRDGGAASPYSILGEKALSEGKRNTRSDHFGDLHSSSSSSIAATKKGESGSECRICAYWQELTKRIGSSVFSSRILLGGFVYPQSTDCSSLLVACPSSKRLFLPDPKQPGALLCLQSDVAASAILQQRARQVGASGISADFHSSNSEDYSFTSLPASSYVSVMLPDQTNILHVSLSPTVDHMAGFPFLMVRTQSQVNVLRLDSLMKAG